MDHNFWKGKLTLNTRRQPNKLYIPRYDQGNIYP